MFFLFNHTFIIFRSKNLDILFKREYYEQKLSVRSKQSENLTKAETSAERKSEKEEDTEGNMQLTGSFDAIDPNQITEFQPMSKQINEDGTATFQR